MIKTKTDSLLFDLLKLLNFLNLCLGKLVDISLGCLLVLYNISYMSRIVEYGSTKRGFSDFFIL
jgi:hypothetical protein